MYLKKLRILSLALCAAAQFSFALPPASDIGDSLPTASTNTLTTTPIAQNQPLELSSPPPMTTSGAASLSSDILDKMASLENQVAQLQNQVDVLQHDLQKTQDQLNKTQAQLDKKITQMAAAPAAPVAPALVKVATTSGTTAAAVAATTSSTPVTASSSTAAVTPEAQEKNTYEAAYSLISTHAYSDASEALSAYLSIYGKDGRYAANANYWLCELDANQQKYPQAVTCFETLITQYPQSSKIPDALLKLGIVNKRMGDDAKAQTWFKRVVQEYPQSTAAQTAKEYV